MVLRVETEWTGGAMGTAMSVMNFGGLAAEPAGVDALLDAVSDFWAGFKDGLPPGFSVHVRNEVQVLDTEDGGLISLVGGAAQPTLTSAGAPGPYPAGVGCRVKWLTDGVRNDRRVVGSTFIAPIAGGNFDTSGTITAAFVTGVTSAANALVAAASANNTPLSVWSRPTSEAAADGFLSEVNAVTVPDKVAWLTSRRQ